jgi:hypothetical protein
MTQWVLQWKKYGVLDKRGEVIIQFDSVYGSGRVSENVAGGFQCACIVLACTKGAE